MTRAEKNCRVEKRTARFSFGTGLALISFAFVAGAMLTWRRWPDLIVDFGLQLYIPWRLADGAVLYRDLFYLAGGPLSQYFHAALFKIFGASFFTLIVANLAITAAMLLLIYHRFRAATDTFTGTIIALAIIIVFAFAQYTGVGNYNYLAPYSHEMLHGLALSLLALTLLANWLTGEKILPAALAGFCAGLVALTKPDIFLALGLTTAAAFTLAFKLKKTVRFCARSLAGFLLAALLPLAGFFRFFLRAENWRESLRLEFFGWRPLFLGRVVNDPFYQWSLGLDAPFEHLRQSSIHFLVAALVVAAVAVLFQKIKFFPAAVHWPLTAIAFLTLFLAARKFNWTNGGAAFPLLGLATLALLWRKFQNGLRGHAIFFPLLWSAFALLLLAKQGVFPRLWHTGFALAMPAFVSAVYLFLWLLPEFLAERFQIPRPPLHTAALTVLLAASLVLAQASAGFYSQKNLPVGHGADLILARGPAGNAVEAHTMNLALDWIEKNVPPRATLAAIPQGALLNFLSRRANSTPCLDWNPTMLAVFGATNMTAALQKNPPDYLALVEWTSYEFGTGYFGTAGYGADVMAWIEKNYQPVALFGSEPLRNGLFGIKIMQRRPPDKAEAPPPDKNSIRL